MEIGSKEAEEINLTVASSCFEIFKNRLLRNLEIFQ